MSILKLVDGKRIIIYGTGNTGLAFYKKYKNEFKISNCTSSDNLTSSINDLEKIRYEELDIKNDFLIVCSIFYEEIRNKLIVDGWTQNINFIRWDIFQVLFDAESYNKLIITMVGQCEINEIYTVMTRINTINQKYCMIYFDERKTCIHGNKFNILDYYDCIFTLRRTDLFLKPSALDPINVSDFRYLCSNVKADGGIITIPLFIFDSYWPQDTVRERTINKYYIVRPKSKIAAYIENDSVINTLLDEGKTAKEIKRIISEKQFFSKEAVLTNHAKALKRVKIADKISTIQISDFVEEKYDKIKLFCDRGHFNENMLEEYVKRILYYLEEDNSIDELKIIEKKNLFEWVNELPIYPSVASILNLSWVNENTYYRMKFENEIKKVTFNEYMELMIEYYYNAKRMIEKLY